MCHSAYEYDLGYAAEMVARICSLLLRIHSMKSANVEGDTAELQTEGYEQFPRLLGVGAQHQRSAVQHRHAG